jgi:glucan-binding YG repeat protein
MLLSAILLACKFNLGGDNTTSDSSKATNRSTAKSDTASKTTANAKPNAEKSDSRRSSDDLAASEDTSDAESNDLQDFKLEIKRTFQVGEKPTGAAQHGDYTILKELDNGGTMGSLHLFKPREAIFILWDGEVIAGPLTTVEQVEEAYEMLGKQSAAEHETRMDIIRKFPTGRNKRVRVYDSKGNIIREDDEP